MNVFDLYFTSETAEQTQTCSPSELHDGEKLQNETIKFLPGAFKEHRDKIGFSPGEIAAAGKPEDGTQLTVLPSKSKIYILLCVQHLLVLPQTSS